MKKYLFVLCLPLLVASCTSESEATNESEAMEETAAPVEQVESKPAPTGKVKQEVKQEVEQSLQAIEKTTSTADSILQSLE